MFVPRLIPRGDGKPHHPDTIRQFSAMKTKAIDAYLKKAESLGPEWRVLVRTKKREYAFHIARKSGNAWEVFKGQYLHSKCWKEIKQSKTHKIINQDGQIINGSINEKGSK